jgi:hypothetical protein
MLYLLLAAAFTAGLFVCFRLYAVFEVPTFQAIMVNYFTCVIWAIALSDNGLAAPILVAKSPYVWFTACLGVLFVSTFYLVGYTAKAVSMTLSSVANKMSMVIPMLVAVFVAGIPSKPLDVLQITGLILAVGSILLSALAGGNPLNVAEKSSKLLTSLLPVAVFLMSGLVDTGINLGNYLYLQEGDKNGFVMSVFFFAGTSGLVVVLLRRMRWSTRILVGGVALGSVNYFSLVFMLQALDAYQNDAVFVFPAINILTILFTGGISVMIFKEVLGRSKSWSLLLALIAMLLLSYKDLFGY